MSNIKAVVFDLDDTLYPEADYVKSGFHAVGSEIEKRFKITNADKILFEYFKKDNSDAYGRLLHDYGKEFTQADIDKLVDTYRTHTPKITLSKETKNTLLELRQHGFKLGIITDGRPYQQHAKIEALGLKDLVDEIIITDELGGIEYRKPKPAAFFKMCELLNVFPEEMIYVGDNPKKDFAIKKYLPIRTVQLLSCGIYAEEEYADGILPDGKISNLREFLNFKNL